MANGVTDDAWFADFEIVRAPRSGIVFRLTALSSRTIRPSTTIAAKDIPFLLPSMLLKGSLGEVNVRLAELDASLHKVP